MLAGYGFQPSPQRIQPLSTIHIDLAADEEAILARMKPKWRYNVRLAERKGVTVREGAPGDLAAIQRLLAATGARDGFGVHSAACYARATELFMAADRPVAGLDDLATWLLAEHEGQLLAAIAVFALGRMAWYMWGASSDEGRNLMPNHPLQWAAMRWARAAAARSTTCGAYPTRWARTRTPTPSRRAGERAACGASIGSSRASAARSCAIRARGICRYQVLGIGYIGWRCG